MSDGTPIPKSLDELMFEEIRMGREHREKTAQRWTPKSNPIASLAVIGGSVIGAAAFIWWGMGIATSLRGMVENSNGYAAHVAQEAETHRTLLHRIEAGEKAMLGAVQGHKDSGHTLAMEKRKALRRDVERLERANRRRDGH